jgi:hypothetical protein
MHICNMRTFVIGKAEECIVITVVLLETRRMNVRFTGMIGVMIPMIRRVWV